MTCPHCGAHYPSPQQTWQERQRALGRCIVCGEACDVWPKGTKRAGETYLHCTAHRTKHNVKGKRARDRETYNQQLDARRRIVA